MPSLRDYLSYDSPQTADVVDQANAAGGTTLGNAFTAGRIGSEVNSLAAEEASLRAAGNNVAADQNRKQIRGLQRRASMYAPAVDRVEEVGLSNFGTYVAGQVGQGAASMMDPAAAAMAGRALAAVPHPITQAVGRVSMLAAPFMINQRQMTGEAYNAMTEDPTLMASTTAVQRRDAANLSGAAGAVLDTALPVMAANRVFGSGLRKGIHALPGGARVAADLVGEGATETGQELIKQGTLGRLNPNRDTSGDGSDLLNSFVGGAIGAGPISAPSVLADSAYRRAGDMADRGLEFGKEAVRITKDGFQSLGESDTAEKAKGLFGRFKRQAEEVDLGKLRSDLEQNLREAPAKIAASRSERNLLLGEYGIDEPIGPDGAPTPEFLQKEDQRAALVNAKLTELAQSNPEAAQWQQRVAQAPLDQQPSVIHEAGTWLAQQGTVGQVQDWADKSAERMGGAARTAASAAGAGAKAAGRAVKGLAQSVARGYKSKRNEQDTTDGQSWTLEDWQQEQAKRKGLVAAMQYTPSPEAKTAADTAASYMGDAAEKAMPSVRNVRSLASDLAYTVTTEAQRAARFGMGKANRRLTTVADKLRAVYGDQATEILDQAAQIIAKGDTRGEMAPGMAKVMSFLKNDLTGQTQDAREQQDGDTAKAMVAALPVEAEKSLLDKGINVRDPDGRTALMNLVQDFAARGTPADRKALAATVGGDEALSKMLDLIDEGQAPEELMADVPDYEESTAEPLSASEATGADEKRAEAGSFEERMAQKRLNRGEAPDQYVYRNNVRRTDGDRTRGVYDEKTQLFGKEDKAAAGENLLEFALNKERARRSSEYDVEAIPAKQFFKDIGREAPAGSDGQFAIRVRRGVPRDEGRMEDAEFERLVNSGRRAVEGARNEVWGQSQEMTERGQALKDKLSKAEAEVYDKRNVIFFQDPANPAKRIPMLAGELAKWGMKRLDKTAPMDGSSSGQKFIAGLLEGLGAVASSGMVGEAMPYRVTADGKKESFAKGIPPSLRVGDKTAAEALQDTRAERDEAAAKKGKAAYAAAAGEVFKAVNDVNERRLAEGRPLVELSPAQFRGMVRKAMVALDQQDSFDANNYSTDTNEQAGNAVDDEFADVQTRTLQQQGLKAKTAPSMTMEQRRVLKAARQVAAKIISDPSPLSDTQEIRTPDGKFEVRVVRPGQLEISYPGGAPFLSWTEPALEVAGGAMGKPQSAPSGATSGRKLSMQGVDAQEISLEEFLANNASGESAASQEAINRRDRERALGQARVRIDRYGNATPMVLSVDARPAAGEVIMQRGVGREEWTVLDRGPGVGVAQLARARQAAVNFDLSQAKYNEQSSQKTNRRGPVATQAEMDEAKAYVEKVLGPKISVEFAKITGYSGEWIEAANTIKLSTIAGPGVLAVAYHEAMHAFWSRLGGNPQVRDLLTNVTSNPALLQRIKGLLAKEPKALAQLADAEERVAYAYQFWAAGQLDVGTKATTLFQKIARFFRRVFGMLRDEDRAAAIFEAFHQGALSEPSAAGRVLAQIMNQDSAFKSARRKLDRQIQWLMRAAAPASTVLATSESKAARELAYQFFTNPGEEAASKYGEGYLNASRRVLGQYLSSASQVLEGLSERDLVDVERYLQKGTEERQIPYEPHRLAVRRVRKLLGKYYKYARDAGIDLGKIDDGKYYPRTWSVDRLVKEKDAFVKLLVDKYKPVLDEVVKSNPQMTVEEAAEALHAELVDRGGVDDKLDAKRDDGVLSPFFAAENRRDFRWMEKADIEPYLEKDIVGQLTRYFRQGVRAAEYTRRFGRAGYKLAEKLDRNTTQYTLDEYADAKQAGKFDRGLISAALKFDPQTKSSYYEVVMAGAIEADLMEQAPSGDKEWISRRMEAIRQATGAMEGTLGKDISPEWRKASSWLMVYQNVRLLPLSLFSSIVDPLGMVARGATMQEAYAGFLRGMRDVVNSYKDMFTDGPVTRRRDAMEELAEAVGAVDSQHYLDSLGQAYASEYLDETARKVNNKLFMLNGMESWNRAMRVQATSSAVRFIENQVNNPGPDSERWLAELGLDSKAVPMKSKKLIVDKKNLGVPADQADVEIAKVHHAINRWVEGAILTPNSAQRPAWASDPHWSFFFHLKQFTYSFHQTIMKRAVNELNHGNLGPMATFIWYVPVMIAADIARGMIQGGGELPAYMKSYTLSDWVMHGIQRAGLTGVGQIGIDAMEDPFSLGGPAVEQVTDAIQDPIGKTVVRALPANGIYKEVLQ